MDHADVSIALRVYVHILPERRKGLATRMDHVLFGNPVDDPEEGEAP